MTKEELMHRAIELSKNRLQSYENYNYSYNKGIYNY